MPQYLYQGADTAESLAAQIKNPQDRLEVVGKQIAEAAGAKIVTGGFSYGEYDVTAIVEAPDEVTMAAVALAIAAGGGGQGRQDHATAERCAVGGRPEEGARRQRAVSARPVGEAPARPAG
jgi:uncharacterized protein with GYD domain